MLTIRPFDWSDDDYETIVAIGNENYPDELDCVEQKKHHDSARDKRYMLERVVGEVHGRPVGTGSFGESSWTPMPGKYWLYVQVLPDHQHKGHGSAIYDHIVDTLTRRRPTILDSFTREDNERAVKFLTGRGYVQVMRGQNSRLTLDEFDASQFDDVVDRVRRMGVRIVSVRELGETDPDWMKKLWELDWALSQDVPEVDEPVKRSFDTYRRQTFEGPTFMPDAFFVALHSGQYVGLTMLEKNLADGTKLQTDLTGVIRSHRRRGIATALKVRAIETARAKGVKYIETDNEEKNPMYKLNVRLGFRPTPGWLHMRKELAGGVEAGRGDTEAESDR